MSAAAVVADVADAFDVQSLFVVAHVHSLSLKPLMVSMRMLAYEISEGSHSVVRDLNCSFYRD